MTDEAEVDIAVDIPDDADLGVFDDPDFVADLLQEYEAEWASA